MGSGWEEKINEGDKIISIGGCHGFPFPLFLPSDLPFPSSPLFLFFSPPPLVNGMDSFSSCVREAMESSQVLSPSPFSPTPCPLLLTSSILFPSFFSPQLGFCAPIDDIKAAFHFPKVLPSPFLPLPSLSL